MNRAPIHRESAKSLRPGQSLISFPRHTAGLDDSAIPHIKIKITEIPLEKKVNVPLLSCWIGARFIDAGEICEFSETAQSYLPCFALCRKTTPRKQRAAKPYKMAMNWAQIQTEKATTGPSLRKYNLFLYLRFNNYFEFLIQSL